MNRRRAAIETLTVGQLGAHCYLVSDSDTSETIVIDPGDEAQYIADRIVRARLTPVMVAATHGHFDHVLAAFELTGMFGVPFAMNDADVFLLERMRQTASHFLGHPVVEPPPALSVKLASGEKLRFGSHTLSVIACPGHTPGGVAFAVDGEPVMFTGDTLFSGGAVGDWRHGYSDRHALMESVGGILSYPDDTELYPGHGERTTVASERQYHPFALKRDRLV